MVLVRGVTCSDLHFPKYHSGCWVERALSEWWEGKAAKPVPMLLLSR